MKQQIKTWGTRLVVLAVLVFGAQRWGVPIYKQYFTPKKTEIYIPTTKVKAGKFVVSFQEIGNLEAEKSVSVDSEINGKIISIVPEGRMISAGQTLAVLDTTELERELRSQTLEYQNRIADVERAKDEMELLKKQNQTDLAQQKAQLDFDKNELDLAKKELEKMQRLLEEKLVTGAQVDQAAGTVRSKDLAVQKGEAQYELKTKEVESNEKQKQAEIRTVEFRADMAKSNLDLAQSQMDNAVVIAPASGLVVLDRVHDANSGRRPLQEGDSVRTQQTICSLPDLTSMQAKVQVGEADAPKVHLDMPTIITLEAVPNKVFHGKVKDISSLATEQNPWDGGTPGQKNFEVTIAVTEVDPKLLKPGMTANIEFIMYELDKAVYIPIEAVVEQQGKTYVFVKEGGSYKRTQIETGRYNDNFIRIIKGLKTGQVIALRDPTRELDQQEAGSAAPGAEKENKKEAAPIPGANN